MQVFSSNDNGSVHFGGNNGTSQNFTSDGNITDKWTFFVNVVTFNGFFWSFETQTNIFIPSLGSSVGFSLWIGEDVRLLYGKSIILFFM